MLLSIMEMMTSFAPSRTFKKPMYLYSFLLNGKGVLIFRTDNPEKAAEIIVSKGLSAIEEKDLSRLL